MSTTITYSDPSIRCFASEIKEIDTDTLLKRKKDIDILLKTGLYPEWMIIIKKNDTSLFNFEYWDLYEVERYKLLTNMELFDRCKKCDFYPKLKFYF